MAFLRTNRKPTPLTALDAPTECYVACMVLGGVGDCLGYRDGAWEFERDGLVIHQQVEAQGGVDKLSPKGFKVSDDTVMLIATARALLLQEQDKVRKRAVKRSAEDNRADLYLDLARQYVVCMEDMAGRSPGITCIRGANQLRPNERDGYIIPFNARGAGCGAAMRSMCIGLRYRRPQEEQSVIEISIESGRMTHNNPIGYLGSLVAAIFTTYAVRKIEPHLWAPKFMQEVMPRAWDYVQKAKRDLEETSEPWKYFVDAWEKYIKLRDLVEGREPIFPEPFGVKERDAYYKSISLGGWGGACGHDAPIIAYDALLAAEGNWKEFCLRGVFHGGDSDSTAIIGGCWFGALYGFKGVPPNHHAGLEKFETLCLLGEDLYEASKRT